MKKISKLTRSLLVLVTVVASFFNTSKTAYASNMTMDKTGYSYTMKSSITGQQMNDFYWKLHIDGKRVFCVELGIYAYNGDGYTGSEFTSSKKALLSKIAYYGYTQTGKTDYDYAVTQTMIWEEVGNQYLSSTLPNYAQRKAEIMKAVNAHDQLPSWENESYALRTDEILTLEDTNGVLSALKLSSNTTSMTPAQNGNSLTLTPESTSTGGTLTFKKFSDDLIGTSIIYKKLNEQSVVEFHLEENVTAQVNIKIIQLGDIEVAKVDELTGLPLAGAKIAFDYDNKTEVLETNTEGKAKQRSLKSEPMISYLACIRLKRCYWEKKS